MNGLKLLFFTYKPLKQELKIADFATEIAVNLNFPPFSYTKIGHFVQNWLLRQLACRISLLGNLIT